MIADNETRVAPRVLLLLSLCYKESATVNISYEMLLQHGIRKHCFMATWLTTDVVRLLVPSESAFDSEPQSRTEYRGMHKSVRGLRTAWVETSIRCNSRVRRCIGARAI